MACILQPKYNFLQGFFRCCLPVEMVDVKVKVTSMQGTHMFRRDRTCQIIKCDPWSTRLCPHPTRIKKIRTYLELEGKLGPKFQPQQNQCRPAQSSTNPLVRRETRVTDKRRKLIPTKRYKVQVVAKPESTPKTINVTTQPPNTAPSASVNSEKENPPQKAHQVGTPHCLKMFQLMLAPHGLEQGQGQVTYLNWGRTGQSLLHLLQIPNKDRATNQRCGNPHTTTMPKAEKCGWGQNCPICKNIEEDWDGNHQKQIQQNIPNTQAWDSLQPQQKNFLQVPSPQQPQKAQQSQMQGYKCPQTQNF